jgi:hypothetical protein
LWKEREEEPTMTREELAEAMRPRLGRSKWLLHSNLWFYLSALLVTLVLQGVNLAGYRNNAAMLAVQIAVTVLAVILTVCGIALMRQVGRLERFEESLTEAVKRRLKFFGCRYEAWLWACAVALVLLAWAFSTMIDNVDGVYRINRPVVFVGVNVAMLLIVYGALKAKQATAVHELRAVLADLDAQILDRVTSVDAWRRRWRWGWWFLLVVLAASVLLGLWRFLAS